MIETTTEKPSDLLPVEAHPDTLPREGHRVPEAPPVSGFQRLVRWIVPMAVLLIGALAVCGKNRNPE